MRHPCRMAGGKRPVSRPAEESGLKPSLATTSAKASERVIADPLGLDRRGSGGVGPVSRAAGKAGWRISGLMARFKRCLPSLRTF